MELSRRVVGIAGVMALVITTTACAAPSAADYSAQGSAALAQATAAAANANTALTSEAYPRVAATHAAWSATATERARPTPAPTPAPTPTPMPTAAPTLTPTPTSTPEPLAQLIVPTVIVVVTINAPTLAPASVDAQPTRRISTTAVGGDVLVIFIATVVLIIGGLIAARHLRPRTWIEPNDGGRKSNKGR